MNEQTKQQLSILLDGELDFDQALSLHEQIEKEPELQALWHRQNLISQALRAEPLALGGENFVSQVSEVVKAEPAFLSPKRRRTFNIPKTALALAASLTFIAFFAFNYLPESVNQSPTEMLVAEQQVSVEPKSVLIPVKSVYDARFNDYLVSHQQGVFAPGMLSQARVVSYSVEQ